MSLPDSSSSSSPPSPTPTPAPTPKPVLTSGAVMEVKPRERDAILQSLRAGVVPRLGLRHLQVGRKEEVAAILGDLDRIAAGGAAVRVIVGRYGAGKSFFLNLARMVALERKFVVMQADLTTDRRLQGNNGQARGLHAELMRNLATRSKPEGGGLASVVERWVSDQDHEVRAAGGGAKEVAASIARALKPLQELVSGYDFAAVITRYYEGFQNHDEALTAAALRWLRGEYRVKAEVKAELGVRSIIEDSQIYDYWKLFAAFVRMAGYAGLLINVDEMSVLSHRLNNTLARNSNYETILRIVNDTLQGSASGVGFIFAGTEDFLEDRRRGLASYEALATRLAQNAFARDGLKDFSGPVIRLSNLSREDLYVLLHNIRRVFFGAAGPDAEGWVNDDGLRAYLVHCSQVLGAEFFLTPRDAVKGFVGLLSILEQNPGTHWSDLIAKLPLGISDDSYGESGAIPVTNAVVPASPSGGATSPYAPAPPLAISPTDAPRSVREPSRTPADHPGPESKADQPFIGQGISIAGVVSSDLRTVEMMAHSGSRTSLVTNAPGTENLPGIISDVIANPMLQPGAAADGSYDPPPTPIPEENEEELIRIFDKGNEQDKKFPASFPAVNPGAGPREPTTPATPSALLPPPGDAEDEDLATFRL